MTKRCAKALIKDYGLSIRAYNKKLREQKGLCWICGNPPKNRSLNIDHRHVKNYKKLSTKDKVKEVRGLLCFRCNSLLGWLEQSITPRKILAKVNEYFTVYKMKNDV